jgi:hypothetical protein
VPHEVFEGVVFGEGLADEFEGEAESSEDRATRYEFGFGAPPFGLPVTGLSEKAGDLRCVGQVDIGAVDRQEPEDSLPKEGRGEPGFEATHKMFPEPAPESESELFSGLAKCLLADTVFMQPWASDAQQSPGSTESLGHGGCLQSHVHHQPRDNFGNERALPSGRTMGLVCSFLEDLRRKDAAKRRQTELLENG